MKDPEKESGKSKKLLSVRELRRQNIEELVFFFSTQQRLVDRIPKAGLDQPHISKIVNGRQMLHSREARAIESDLGIPELWLDRYPLNQFHEVWKALQDQPARVRDLVNTALRFAQDVPPSAE